MHYVYVNVELLIRHKENKLKWRSHQIGHFVWEKPFQSMTHMKGYILLKRSYKLTRVNVYKYKASSYSALLDFFHRLFLTSLALLLLSVTCSHFPLFLICSVLQKKVCEPKSDHMPSPSLWWQDICVMLKQEERERTCEQMWLFS